MQEPGPPEQVQEAGPQQQGAGDHRTPVTGLLKKKRTFLSDKTTVLHHGFIINSIDEALRQPVPARVQFLHISRVTDNCC